MTRLETELYLAREAIVNMAPPPYNEILSTNPDDSVKYARDWLRDVVEKILARVNAPHPDPKVIGRIQYDTAMRIPCPLCRSTGLNPRSTGFVFPHGLTRHLLGEYGAQMCPVTHAAEELCKEDLRSDFRFA